MIDPEDDETLRAALRRLPREIAPPPRVRAVVAARVPSRTWRTALRGAMAAALLVAAFWSGRATAPRDTLTAVKGQEFALLLYGDRPGGTDARAAEYADWAVARRREGRRVFGERLAGAGWTAGETMIDPAPLQGFFIVEARDADEALDLARRHPHARIGTVLVRPIDTPRPK